MKVLFILGLIVTIGGAVFLNTAIIIFGLVLMVMAALGEAVMMLIRRGRK